MDQPFYEGRGLRHTLHLKSIQDGSEYRITRGVVPFETLLFDYVRPIESEIWNQTLLSPGKLHSLGTINLDAYILARIQPFRVQ
jgi:hypothetical protein